MVENSTEGQGEQSKPFSLELQTRQEQRTVLNFLAGKIEHDEDMIMLRAYTPEGVEVYKAMKNLANQLEANISDPQAGALSLMLTTENEQRGLRHALVFSLVPLTEKQVLGKLSPEAIEELQTARRLVAEITSGMGEELILGEKLMIGLVEDVSDEDLQMAVDDPRDWRALSFFAEYFLKQRHDAE